MEGYRRNRFYLSELLTTYKPLFIFIQEHWLPEHLSHENFSNDFQSYNFLTTSADMFTPVEERILNSGPIWHGTALGWDKSIDHYVSKIPVLNERFCGIKYTDSKSGTSIVAFTAYFPTSGHDDTFLETLSQLSIDITNHKGTDDILIIGLDSNQSDKSTRRRSEGMDNFLQRFSLNTVMKNTVPTFHHQNQSSESQIDHILYSIPKSSDVNVTLKKILCLLEHPHNLSSHDALVGNLTFPDITIKRKEEDFSHLYTPFIISKPLWEEAGLEGYRKDTFKLLKYLTDEFTADEHIPILSELVSNALTFSAESNFRSKKPQKPNRNTYFSDTHRDAYLKHRKVCKEWRLQGRPSDSSHPAKQAKVKSQREVQRVAREEEANKAKEFNDDLMNSFHSNINFVYKKLKASRGQFNHNNDIPFIETINGVYSDNNVLEGFCINTESLCTVKSESEISKFAKIV